MNVGVLLCGLLEPPQACPREIVVVGSDHQQKILADARVCALQYEGRLS